MNIGCEMYNVKEQIRCKLEVTGKITEQVMKFNYLTSLRNSNEEIISQISKASWVKGCMDGLVWKSEENIYKVVIWLTLTYVIDTRADTIKTKQELNTRNKCFENYTE